MDARIPRPVVEELLAGPTDDAAARWAQFPPIPTEENISTDEEILAWDLGFGESAVLSCCRKSPGSVAVLDDRAARNCATTFSIPVIGTLGLLLRAKYEGLIPAIEPEIRNIVREGSFLSEAVIQHALIIANERG